MDRLLSTTCKRFDVAAHYSALCPVFDPIITLYLLVFRLNTFAGSRPWTQGRAIPFIPFSGKTKFAVYPRMQMLGMKGLTAKADQSFRCRTKRTSRERSGCVPLVWCAAYRRWVPTCWPDREYRMGSLAMRLDLGLRPARPYPVLAGRTVALFAAATPTPSRACHAAHGAMWPWPGR